jgi:hypothetical protein
MRKRAMGTEAPRKTKRPYERPKLRIIDLAAEEVLAVGCKVSDGGIAFGGSPCPANNCNQAGS